MAPAPIELKLASREMIRGPHAGALFTYSAELEHKSGYVLALADLDASCPQAQRIRDLLHDALQALAQGLDAESHLQHRFEQTLHVINTSLQALLEEHPFPLESLHMLVGVVRGRAFIVSSVGQLQALFLRKTEKQRFRLFDLASSLQTERGKIKSEKVFSVVLDGDLQPDDVFIIASRQLHQLLNMEELHPLLSTLPPAGALETIEQYLPAKGALAMFLLQVRRQKDVLVGYGPRATGHGSMELLKTTEEATESILERERPHIFLALKKLITAVRNGNTLERRQAVLAVMRWLGAVLKAAGLYALYLLNNLLVSLVNLLVAAVSSPSKRQRALKRAKDVWQRALAPKQGITRETTVSGKVLILLACGCLVLFLGSTALLRAKHARAERQVAFQQTLERVQALRDSASASRIYHDERAALTDLRRAQELLATIEPANTQETNRVQEQQTAVQEDLKQIQHIVTPEVHVTTFSNQVVQAASQDLLLFQDGTARQILDSATPSVDLGASLGTVSRVARRTDGATVFYTDGTLADAQLEAHTTTRIGMNSAEGELSALRDAMHYGERLYVLTDRAIYRHQRVANGEYGPAVTWLQDAADLSSLHALAVDGTIWLGGGTDLRHFDQGREVGADVTSIDPPLKDIRALWTQADDTSLYILDAGGERVIVYDKATGRLVSQYVDARFGQAISLYVDAQQTVWVTLPTQLLSFPLTPTT